MPHVSLHFSIFLRICSYKCKSNSQEVRVIVPFPNTSTTINLPSLQMVAKDTLMKFHDPASILETARGRGLPKEHRYGPYSGQFSGHTPLPGGGSLRGGAETVAPSPISFSAGYDTVQAPSRFDPAPFPDVLSVTRKQAA